MNTVLHGDQKCVRRKAGLRIQRRALYLKHTETSYLYNNKDMLEMTLASFGKDLGSSIFQQKIVDA